MAEFNLEFINNGHLTEEINGNTAVCYHRTPDHFESYPTCPWNPKNPSNIGLSKKQLNAKRAANSHWTPSIADVLKYELLPNCWTDETLTGQCTQAIRDMYGGNITWGFRAGSGAMYGVGMYSTFRDPRKNTQTKGYGKLIIKFGVHNMSNYLFTDFTEFKKTPRYTENPDKYTEDNYLSLQLIEAGVPANLFAKFESKCSFQVSGQEIIEHYGRDRFAWDFAPYFLGFVYTGGNNDGDVLVTFDIGAMESKSISNSSLATDEDLKSAYHAIYNNPSTKARFKNIQTLYPLGFSIDGGQTYTPIPVGQLSKKRIIDANRAWHYNNIQYNYDKSFNNSSTLMNNYIVGNRIYIPSALIDCGLLNAQSVKTTILNNPDLDLVVPNIAKAETYELAEDVIESTGRKGFIVRLMADVFDEQHEHSARGESFSGFASLVMSVSKLYIDTVGANQVTMVANATGSIIPLMLEKNISKITLGKFIVRSGGLAQLIGKKFFPAIAVVDSSDPNMARASEIFPNSYIIVTHKMNELIDYFRWHTINDGKQWEKCSDRKQFEAAQLQGRKIILKTDRDLSFMKYWDGLLELVPVQTWKSTQPERWTEIRNKAKVIILDKVVISPTKDELTGRQKSYFPADKRLGIRNLSIIGWHEPLGSEKTTVQRCGCDLKAFESLRNYLYIENYLGLYLPEAEDPIKITNEFIQNIKACTSSRAGIGVYYRGEQKNQVDISELNKESVSWWNSHSRPYNKTIFSNYVDASAEDIEEYTSKKYRNTDRQVSDETDDDILNSVAAEADNYED